MTDTPSVPPIAPSILAHRVHIPARLGEPTGTTNRVWLISFTDIMGLMLTFFVMTYAMTESVTPDLSRATNILQNDTGSFYGPPLDRGDSDVITLPRLHFDPGLDAAYLSQVLDRKREETPALRNLTTRVVGRDINISIPMADILRTGETSVSPDRRAALTELAVLLQSIPNQLELVVSPISTRGADISRSLQRGQIIAAALKTEGLTQTIPILVNREPSSGKERLILRVTRFRADQTR